MPTTRAPTTTARCARYLPQANIYFFFFQAEDGIRDYKVTGVQTCALPIFCRSSHQFLAAAVPKDGHGLLVLYFGLDRKSTRLNSSHLVISYAVFCLKKKKKPFTHLLFPTKKNKKNKK